MFIVTKFVVERNSSFTFHRSTFFQRPIISSIGMAMAVRGKEAAAILPEPRPDAFAVGLRDVQAVQCGAREELKATFAHGRRELLELRFQLEQKHQPVCLSLKAVFAHDAREVEVGGRKFQAEFLVRLARGADVGRFAEVGLEFAAARTPEAEVGLLGAFEQEDFIALVEAVEQCGDFVGQGSHDCVIEEPTVKRGKTIAWT